MSDELNNTGNSNRTAPGTPFKPGQSGNPTGRPKMPDEVKEAIKANTLPAVNTLIEIMQTGKPELKIKAAEIILDRAYGKAAQPIVGDNEHDPVSVNILNPEQRKALLDAHIRRIASS
jgi:hypothetical protein